MRVTSLYVVGKPKSLILEEILVRVARMRQRDCLLTIVNDSFYICKTIKVVNLHQTVTSFRHKHVWIRLLHRGSSKSYANVDRVSKTMKNGRSSLLHKQLNVLMKLPKSVCILVHLKYIPNKSAVLLKL